MSEKRAYVLSFVLGAAVALGLLLLISTVAAERPAAPNDGFPLPPQFTYQGQLVDSTTGDPVPDGSYDMVFTIYDDPAAGNALWTQGFTGTHAVQVTGGQFSVNLGTLLNPLLPDLFPGARRWLGIQVGTDPEMTPRTEIVSVPYALRAETLRSGGVTSDNKVTTLYKFKNTNATAYALVVEGRFHVQGDAHVQGTLSWMTRTARISIPAPAFQPREEDYDYVIEGSYLKSVSGREYYAPVQLPDGCLVTKMTLHYIDNDTENGVSTLLYRKRLAGEGQEQMAGAISSDGGMGSDEDDTIEHARINNEDYIYYVAGFFGASPNVWLMGVVIEYEYTKP